MSRPTLPFLGLGLSTNLDARDRPHPYRMLEAEPGILDFVEYSAPLPIAQARREASLFGVLLERRAEVPALFHPVHLNLYGPELASAAELSSLDEQAREVGSPWVGNDVGWWHTAGRPFPGYQYIAPPLTAEGLDDCVHHALHAQAALSIPLALENPVVMAARGDLHVLDFMAELHARSGLPLIIDIGHLLSHQIARRLVPDAGCDGFPWEAVIELHFAGGAVLHSTGGDAVYLDDHVQPVLPEVWSLLETVLPRCRSLRALTYEGDGHPEGVAAAGLKRARILLESCPAPRLPVSIGEARKAPSARPLAVRRHDWRPPFLEGSEGWVRRTVLAQSLDRELVFSRLALAPNDAALSAWLGSEASDAAFAHGEHDAATSFGRWARGTLRNRSDVALEVLVAFDLWARAALDRVGGAPVTAIFPSDLSEALHAASLLRRELTGGAWVDSPFAEARREAMLAAAARAPSGPWKVELRRRGARVEVAAPRDLP